MTVHNGLLSAVDMRINVLFEGLIWRKLCLRLVKVEQGLEAEYVSQVNQVRKKTDISAAARTTQPDYPVVLPGFTATLQQHCAKWVSTYTHLTHYFNDLES